MLQTVPPRQDTPGQSVSHRGACVEGQSRRWELHTSTLQGCHSSQGEQGLWFCTDSEWQMLLWDGSKITIRSLFENTRELSGVFKDSSRFIRMLLCPNHMAMSQAATVAQGERTLSCGIKGSHHPLRRVKSSQPKACFPPHLTSRSPFQPGWMLQALVAFLHHLDELETFLKQLPGLCSASPYPLICLAADSMWETSEQPALCESWHTTSQ